MSNHSRKRCRNLTNPTFVSFFRLWEDARTNQKLLKQSDITWASFYRLNHKYWMFRHWTESGLDILLDKYSHYKHRPTVIIGILIPVWRHIHIESYSSFLCCFVTWFLTTKYFLRIKVMCQKFTQSTSHFLLYGWIDSLVQERRNSIANALELRLSCTNTSICGYTRQITLFGGNMTISAIIVFSVPLLRLAPRVVPRTDHRRTHCGTPVTRRTLAWPVNHR